MKNIKNIFTLLVVALVGLSLAACSEDDLDTNQYQGGVTLNAYGPNPVMRGGQLRFLGSNLDQVARVVIPSVDPITNIQVVQAGTPSEIRVTVPKDYPTPGQVTLVTSGGQRIITKTVLNFIEGVEITSVTESVMPGDIVKIEGDYLNLIYSLAFADGVVVGESDFVSHDRYAIEVRVPDEAKTGKLELYTADLTVVDPTSTEYQIIQTEQAVEIGLPTVSKVKGRAEVDALNAITAKAGETITITGTYFNVAKSVKVGGTEVTAITVSDDAKTITFALPAAAPDGDIVIITKSDIEVPVGTITTVKPSNAVAAPAPVKAGAQLTITGQDMDVVTSVEFPGANALSGDAITVAADKVVVNAVPETATAGNLKLIMANGASIEVPFTLVLPTVTAYSANPVSAGAELQITGTDLDLVKSIAFGTGVATIAEGNVSADGTTITVTVPMDAQSGKPVFTLANNDKVEGAELTVEEAKFCYAVALPTADDEAKAGQSMTVTVANGDKLTAVQIDGNDCQWILTGEDKNQLIIGIPETAGQRSKLRLVSSNGEITYDVAIIPATSVSKTIWSGLLQITWDDGGRVMVPASAFEGVPAGAILTFAYTQVQDQWDQAQINYGNWSGINFTEGGEGVVTFNGILVPTDIYGWFSDGILNRETSVILTQEILDNIQANKGNCEDQTDCGIIIQGSGLTFSKITIAWENSLDIDLWKGSLGPTNWNGDKTIPLTDEIKAELIAGRTMGIDFVCDADGGQVEICGAWWTGLEGPKDVYGRDTDNRAIMNFSAADTNFEWTLTQGDIDILVNQGAILFVGNGGLTITRWYVR